MSKTDLIVFDPREGFAKEAFAACMVLSASKHTRRAYWTDTRHWLEFCKTRKIDPSRTEPIAVAAWVESMKLENLAPKTRYRRLSALSSVYDNLRRNGKVAANPFSPSEGPKRESAHAEKPTPIAEVATVKKAVALCEAGETLDDVRDAAIMRVLWSTGARKVSVVQITRERLAKTKAGGEAAYTCEVPSKGGKKVRLWIGNKAAVALTKLLRALDKAGHKTGHVFRMSTGRAMDERDLWRAISRRGKQAGGTLSPHSFRVAFLTLNPASLEARQDAAGHSNPATTRLYDRRWRGKSAFTSMPDVEDAEIDGEGEDNE